MSGSRSQAARSLARAVAPDRPHAGSRPFRSARDARTLAENFPPAAAREGRTLPPAGRHRRAVIAGARTRRVPPRGGSAGPCLSGLPFETLSEALPLGHQMLAVIEP